MNENYKSKNIVRSISIVIIILIFILLGIYIALSEYYKDGFSYGTWINGIYCTGKSVEEVNEELLKHCTYNGLTVYDKDGNTFAIEAADIDFGFDFKKSLQMYLDRQNPYLWIDNLFAMKEHNLVPVISFNEEKLYEVYKNIPFLSENTQEKERDVYIIKTFQGYELVNERFGILNREKAMEVIHQSLLEFESKVDLNEQQCYEDLALTEKMADTVSLWKRIEEFQNCHIIYKLGDEQVSINASIVCNWILTDVNGDFMFDENGHLKAEDSMIEEFIDSLADEYDTVGGIRYFKATRGETVMLEGGIYGNIMDRKAEKAYLKEAFRLRLKEIHEPEYIHKAYKQGKDDIGKTYIEVDMSEQMMYYYENGKLELQTPIVTGNTGRRMGTPSGVNYVYNKQENRVLRGPGYASPVKFWMPVKGNIGIHDASWRSEFGEEIYKTNGSHGCINTPYEAMVKLYQMADVGTPVVMFY